MILWNIAVASEIGKISREEQNIWQKPYGKGLPRPTADRRTLASMMVWYLQKVLVQKPAKARECLARNTVLTNSGDVTRVTMSSLVQATPIKRKGGKNYYDLAE